MLHRRSAWVLGIVLVSAGLPAGVRAGTLYSSTSTTTFQYAGVEDSNGSPLESAPDGLTVIYLSAGVEIVETQGSGFASASAVSTAPDQMPFLTSLGQSITEELEVAAPGCRRRRRP